MARRTGCMGLERFVPFTFPPELMLITHTPSRFVQHPWSKIPDTFINLDGAGAGGPPLLFRATSLAPVKAFAHGFTTNSTTYRVSHPHGNVLSTDAFQRGVVRSGTDYSIYMSRSGRSMEGIDLAFYNRRSRYHTMFDSIPGVKGKAKESLWAMLETVWAAGGVLLNIELTENPGSDANPVVYFDLFKQWFLVFEQRTLHILHLAILLGSPLLVLFLNTILPLLCGHFHVEIEGDKPSVLSRVFAPVTRLIRRSAHDETSDSDTSSTDRSCVCATWSYIGRAWAWSNAWIPFVLFVPSVIFIPSVTWAVLAVNKYIIYSQPYTVMLSYLSIVLVVITFLLGSPSISAKPRSPRKSPVYVLPDRQATFIHLYIFTYLLLILASLALFKLQVGGLYWISAWHAGVCAACIIGGAETFYMRFQRIKELRKKKRGGLFRRDASLGGRSSGDTRGSDDSSSDSDEDATETMPLLPGSSTHPEQSSELASDDKAWWILQALFSIPVPVMLIGHVLLLFQTALGQTLSDGSSAAFVYLSNGLLCFFIILPIAPFASAIHRYVAYIAILAFLGCLVFNLVAFPFSQDTPLKVVFQQSVQLNSSATDQGMSNTGTAREVIRAVTSLTGVNEMIKDGVVSKLPSSWGKDVKCTLDTSGRWTGLATCSWDSDPDMIPYPGGIIGHPWLTVDAERLGPTKFRIVVEGKNARACRIYFDEMQIVEVSFAGEGENAFLTLSPRKDGDLLSHWSRRWGRKFAVELDIKEVDRTNKTQAIVPERTAPEDGFRNLRGRVACEWAEYESGIIGLGLEKAGCLGPKIPALEEVFRFLPQWAIVSNADDGLVEAWSEFRV
ncbi:hypothetical protein AX15_001877 [Amanita polypyramis BW_CC]|nr:hypothetical protein AX15_001877 [Amanita polypyramis BW_CC]